MRKFIFIANAVLVLPFGIAALAAPGAVFAGFGLALDPGAQLIARGYAATSLGYGIVFLLLRNTTQGETARALLAASTVFNLIEFLIQAVAGTTGIASPAVWGTVVAHGIMTVLSALAFLRGAGAGTEARK
jgi:hypothetical protein